jgi:transposase-like protein
VNMTRNNETIEVMVSDQRRRRWSPSERAEFVRQTYEMGSSVSAVARKSAIAASQLFYWRKLEHPQSNGIAESFVNTFKRDYVSKMNLDNAFTVLAQLPAAFDYV